VGVGFCRDQVHEVMPRARLAKVGQMEVTVSLNKTKLACAILSGLLACACAGAFVASTALGLWSRSNPVPPATSTAHPAVTAPMPAAGTTLSQTVLDENMTLVAQAQRPDRDQLALVERLKATSASTPMAVATPAPRLVGAVETFWVGDQNRNEHFVVTATLRYVTQHAYFYVDNTQRYDANGLRNSADTFASKTFPNNIRVFGDYWRPGLDGDSRVTILNTLTPGAGGYFSSADEYRLDVNRYSNQRRMIYVDVKSYPIGTTRYDAVLAHEMQHAIHWMADPGEDSWVNEGLSELAAQVNGFPVGRAYAAFGAAPDTQLNDWSDQSSQNTVHYGASYAFLSYFLQRFGESAIRELVADPAHGLDGFRGVLQRQSPSVQFDDVFRDWVVANFVNDPAVGDGRFGYVNLDLHASSTDVVTAMPQSVGGQVRQFAATYTEIRTTSIQPTLYFTGAKQVSLTGAQAHSGLYFWWGNRGDSMDTRLTRQLDLTGLAKATVSYWLWYDIEENWDYGYVEVSTDNGSRWTTLPARRTTNLDPEGQNYGNGYTGQSGGWVADQVDLTAFVGGKVLLRFEYVTDDAVNNPGMAVDDVCLVETGQCDDAEAPGDWAAEGFVRVTAALPQRYAVQLIEFGDTIRIRQVPLDAQNRGTLALAFTADRLARVVVVVSGLTPVTTEPALYEMSFAP
jgi:immune inhibitor A